MTIAIDSKRGEIPLTIGGIELAVSADIHRLAAVSTRLGCQSLSELFHKIVTAEPNAPMGCRLLTVTIILCDAVRGVINSDLASGTGVAKSLKQFSSASNFSET
jgi:hypothetical protein